MANTAQNFQPVFITYLDIKQAHPNWPDKAIEDYLSLKRDLLLVSEVGDVDSDRLDDLGARMEALEIRVDILESKQLIFIVTSVDHTTTRNEWVECQDSLTVKLNSTPLDLEEVSVKRAAGSVTIDGNGKLVNGESSIVLNRKEQVRLLIYSSALDSWGVR